MFRPDVRESTSRYQWAKSSKNDDRCEKQLCCFNRTETSAKAPLTESKDVCPQAPGNARFALGRFADVCEKRRLETMRKLREWRSMKRRKRRRREEVNFKISGGQDRLCKQDSGTEGERFGN